MRRNESGNWLHGGDFCPDIERMHEAEQIWEDNVFSVESGLVGCTQQWSGELGQGYRLGRV